MTAREPSWYASNGAAEPALFADQLFAHPNCSGEPTTTNVNRQVRR